MTMKLLSITLVAYLIFVLAVLYVGRRSSSRKTVFVSATLGVFIANVLDVTFLCHVCYVTRIGFDIALSFCLFITLLGLSLGLKRVCSIFRLRR